MGGCDKALVELAGRPLLAHAIARATPQVSRLVINANGDPARFDAFGLPVVADSVTEDDGGSAGPLAGVLAGMEWAAAHAADCRWIATFPTDAPFFPADLVPQLADATANENVMLACAESRGRRHPVFGLWPVDLQADLRRSLVEDRVRKVESWTARHGLACVSFPASVVDPFFNINRPDDVNAAAEIFTKLNS
tara:strand:+ start:203 stop:784 length:582 start_codon:yes stop_codon:yes gene_type:complete